MSQARVFQLIPDNGSHQVHFGYSVVILPESTDESIIRNAWTYAVRYSAKGIDLPDYDAAIELLKKRHPSWMVVVSPCIAVYWNTNYPDNDPIDT